MTKCLLTYQFFIGAVIGGFICFILGAVLATFLYLKNIDVANIRRDQEYLIQEVEELRKERQELTYIFKERELIKEHNKQTIIVPEEEGK